MVAILLALVSLSGSRVECVAVVAVAWKNVLLHLVGIYAVDTLSTLGSDSSLDPSQVPSPFYAF
jgi:hypothetical protein